MKGAVLYKVGEPLRIEEIDMPPVGDEDVLIRVAACGVCHTDLKVVQGRSAFKPPNILGHEVSGIVEKVGRDETDVFKEGDRVIVGMRYKCGRCYYCTGGWENLCRNRPTPPSWKMKDGTAVHRWNVGGFTQYLAVPGYMVFAAPQALALEEASVIGCRITTAYNAVKHGARLSPSDSALVIGCGGIGLNTIQFLRCFGAYPIIAVDLIEEKLAAAKKFGATHTVDASKDDPVEAARSITGGGVAKSFEAIGNPKTADQIIRATRPGGTAVIIGGLGRGPFTISDGRFTMNEIKVTGVSSRRATDVHEVLRMIEEGRIKVMDLVTRKYPFERINEAFGDLERGRVLMGVSLWN